MSNVNNNVNKKSSVRSLSKEELLQKKALQRKKTMITLSIVCILIFGWIIYVVWDDATHSTKSNEATEIVSSSIDAYLSGLVSE